MKKIIAIALMVAVIMLCATGCNSKGDTPSDTPSTNYEYAYVSLPNGDIIEVALKDFYRYKTHIVIFGQDGAFYSVSFNNCILTNIQLDYTESEE